MANVIGWVIGIGLILLVNMISVPIHGMFESRVRPPEASSPRKAPYPVEVYYNAEVASSSLESTGDNTWHYSWKMTSKSDASTVAAFYKEKYPKADFAGDEGYYEMELVPEGAKGDEHVSITIMSPEAAEADKTTVQIDELKEGQGGFVPDLWVIRVGLWGLVLGVFTVGQRPLAQVLGRVFVSAHAARGGSQYQRLEGPPDAAALETWKEPQAVLEQAGFHKAFDSTVTTAGFPNCARLLDREGKTQALLQYAVVNQQPYTYVEMQTWFEDGSTLTTSTSRYAGTLNRPERHALVQFPERTGPAELLRRHEEAVASRERAGQVVAAMETATLFDARKRVEEECLANLQGQAPLTKQGLDLATERPGTAPPPPQPAIEEAPAPPSAPAADDKATFADEVAERLRGLNPALTVARKDVMTLTVGHQDLDLETVYFMCRNNPGDKDKILAGFLGRFAPRS